LKLFFPWFGKWTFWRQLAKSQQLVPEGRICLEIFHRGESSEG